MQKGVCPCPERLRSYLFGYLADSDSDIIAEHVSDCVECDEVLVELEKTADSLSNQLSDDTKPSEFEREPQLQRALNGIRRLVDQSAVNDDSGEPESRALGEYRLWEKVGSGAMGTVYKAEHLHLKRNAAVKLLPLHRKWDAQAIARFKREMEAIGKLDHDNIVRAYDAGEHKGQPYLVMEYLEGIDLSRLVSDRGPLPIDDACELIRQAALGLQHAHQIGLVHRDVKPSNLMLSSDGKVKVLDLGLALLQPHDEVVATSFNSEFIEDASSDGTGTQDIMGTLDYIAPEQTRDTHRVDFRADVYGLGCTLYKLLTGRAPFADPQHDTRTKKLNAHANQEPTPVTDHRDDIRNALGRIVHRMLAKNPSERFETAGAVAEALKPFTRGNNVQGLLPESIRPHFTKTSVGTADDSLQPRRPRRMLRIAVTFVAAGLLLATLIHQAIQRRPSAAPSVFTEEEALGYQNQWAMHLELEAPFFENSIGMKLALIPPGRFMMGTDRANHEMLRKERISPRGLDALKLERPRHLVRVKRPFFIGRHEVTVGQFREFVRATGYKTEAETNKRGGYIYRGYPNERGDEYYSKDWYWEKPAPGVANSDMHPVVQVSWDDAIAFCKWLSEKEGRRYTLPTEQQWEYACRAGTDTLWICGDNARTLDDYASYGTWDYGTSEVGNLRSNNFGLWDTHGNVWEWCRNPPYQYKPDDNEMSASSHLQLQSELGADSLGITTTNLDGTDRAVRGGAQYGADLFVRSAVRLSFEPTLAHCSVGFRVVLEIE